MSTLVKQIFVGLWQVFTLRAGWVNPIKNSLPVAAFLGVVALVIKSLALFISYLIDPQTPLSFAFAGVAVELVSMLLGLGLVVLIARQRKRFPTLLAGLMYLAILSVFVGALVGMGVSGLLSTASLTEGQMQSLWQMVALGYMLWFVASVLAIIKHGLHEKWWRAVLLMLVFMAISHVVVGVWQKLFFPQIL